MPCKFNHFKSVRQRMRRTLNYGKAERINCLNEPLTSKLYLQKKSIFRNGC